MHSVFFYWTVVTAAYSFFGGEKFTLYNSFGIILVNFRSFNRFSKHLFYRITCDFSIFPRISADIAVLSTRCWSALNVEINFKTLFRHRISTVKRYEILNLNYGLPKFLVLLLDYVRRICLKSKGAGSVPREGLMTEIFFISTLNNTTIYLHKWASYRSNEPVKIYKYLWFFNFFFLLFTSVLFNFTTA